MDLLVRSILFFLLYVSPLLGYRDISSPLLISCVLFGLSILYTYHYHLLFFIMYLIFVTLLSLTLPVLELHSFSSCVRYSAPLSLHLCVVGDVM